MDVETWVPISLSPPADFRKQFASFSLITVSRARTNTAHCAVALSRKAMSVIHGHGSSTAIRSASREGHVWRCPSSKIAGGKCHEMLKSRLHPRHWSRPLGRVVQQAAPLFKELPRCSCGYRSSGAIARRTKSNHLLRLAFRTTGFARAAEAGAGRHPSALRAKSEISVGGAVTTITRNEWRWARLRPNPRYPRHGEILNREPILERLP
jgi:hypothetical protein